MSSPASPNQRDLPQSAVSELHTIYREGAADEPDAMLDRRIIDAARSALHDDQTRKANHTTSWWKTWAKPASVFAIMILGISLSWNVMDEQERATRDEMISAERTHELASQAKTKDTRTASAASAQAPMKETTTKDAAAMAEKKQGFAPQVAPVAEPQAFPARQDSAKSEASATGSLAKPSAVADAPAEVELRKAVAAPPPAILAPAPAAALAMPTADASAERANKSSAKRLASTALSKESDATDDAANPEAWLDQIRKLRAAGRNAEAAQSLERFRKRYPNVALPDDLLGVKAP